MSEEDGAGGELVLRKPSLDLAQMVALLKAPKSTVSAAHALLEGASPSVALAALGLDKLRDRLLAAIEEDDMAPFYTYCCEQLGWKRDEALFQRMTQANAEALKKLDAAIKDAEENQGEIEIRDARIARAVHFVTIGDKTQAEGAFRLAYEKTVSIGLRMDLCFAQIRVGLFYDDKDLIKRNIEKAEHQLEQGGDWDRRNRLKVYQGLHMIIMRNFRAAATLFLETVSTFTSTELMSYTSFVGLTVLVCIISLERTQLRDKVVEGPEIREALHELPLHRRFLDSLYNCQYQEFFKALAEVEKLMSVDRIFAEHARFYVREMRVKAYSQLLQSYRSVTLASMASSFGVSVEFIDSELSRFVAAGRLNCKIDKVSGIVETTRPDQKNAQYQAVIKKGDHVLNRLQKLAQIINV